MKKARKRNSNGKRKHRKRNRRVVNVTLTDMRVCQGKKENFNKGK